MKSRWQCHVLGFSASIYSLRCEEKHSNKIKPIWVLLSQPTSHRKMSQMEKEGKEGRSTSSQQVLFQRKIKERRKGSNRSKHRTGKNEEKEGE